MFNSFVAALSHSAKLRTILNLCCHFLEYLLSGICQLKLGPYLNPYALGSVGLCVCVYVFKIFLWKGQCVKDSCDMFGRSCNELDCFLLFVICMALLIARKISFGVQPSGFLLSTLCLILLFTFITKFAERVPDLCRCVCEDVSECSFVPLGFYLLDSL